MRLGPVGGQQPALRARARAVSCARRLEVVKRVLLTGMSATGKSAVVRELVARGYKAIDTDDGWCKVVSGGRQLWREDAVERLLAVEDADVLFVAGCEENQVRFHAQFDHIILLSAPVETLMQRLATRTSNPFGKSPDELRRVLDDVQAIEPLLRRVADHEVRTTAPLQEVVTTILGLVDVAPATQELSIEEVVEVPAIASQVVNLDKAQPSAQTWPITP
jgi:shikimate kinase